MSITLLIEFPLLNHHIALAFRIKRKSKAMAPAIDISQKWTVKSTYPWRPPVLLDIVLVPSKALKNMFFMFRLRSLNTLLIALYRGMTLFELPSRTRHKNLWHRVFVMGLSYLINMLSSDESDMLVDLSAPRGNLLTKDSSMAVPVSLWLLIVNWNLSNVVTDK